MGNIEKERKEYKMLNQVIIVGKIIEQPTLIKLDNGNSKTEVKLSIPRVTKDEESRDIVSDILVCTFRDEIAENVVEYCKKGTTVGIKARLESKEILCLDKTTQFCSIIVGEKVTYINVKKED